MGDSGIRISSMTVWITRIPVRAVHSHGIGDMGGSSTNVILRLDTDAGIIGWGEGAPWAVFTGTAEANAAALHTYFRPFLIGADPFRVEQLMRRADATVVHCSEAKAALETALLDIVGQARGLPICGLLGGAFRDEIPLSFSIADPDFDADLDLAQQLYKEGLRLFKVKTGFAGHRADLKRMERLRSDLPDDVELRIDYNQGLQPWNALPPDPGDGTLPSDLHRAARARRPGRGTCRDHPRSRHADHGGRKRLHAIRRAARRGHARRRPDQCQDHEVRRPHPRQARSSASPRRPASAAMAATCSRPASPISPVPI